MVISPTELHAFVTVTGRSMTIPRDGREWAAFGRWLAARRAEPLLEGFDLIRLVPRAGVRYAEIVRALELADHHGFGRFKILSGPASEVDRPGPLRLTLSPDHLEGAHRGDRRRAEALVAATGVEAWRRDGR